MDRVTVVLEGSVNFRDLGGHATDEGRAVRRGKLFRAGSLSTVTDADLAVLEDLAIRTVVDLRMPSQIETFGPDRIPDGARYVSLPMGGGDVSRAIHDAMRTGRFASLPDVEEVNLTILREDAVNIAAFIQISAEPENLPLIFHCIGGKDRTGIAASLVLSLLGVPWDTVRADYVRTNDHLADAVDAELEGLARAATERSGRRPAAIDLAAARRFATVVGSDLDAVRDEMIGEAGSIEAYVHDELGIASETVQSLRDQLLE